MSFINKALILLIVFMGGIFVAGVFFGEKEAEPETEPVAVVEQEVPDTPAPMPELEPETGQDEEGYKTAISSDGKSSYRVRAGTASSANRPQRAADNTPARIAIDWEDEFVAQDVLESAIVGDIDDAVSVGELIMQCRSTYSSEQQLQSAMNRIGQSVGQGNPIPHILVPGTGETMKFNNFTEYENISWQRFAECQATDGMFDGRLRDRLAEEARAGSVTARFLYAMWLPKQHEINSQRLIEWITYQSNAWDFTWANIREGEPLGLLAYGRSLEQSGSIYFTPRHLNYGPAFILAAQKCGMQNQILDEKINNITGYWQDRRMMQRLNQATNLSDEIARMFCG